MARQTIEAMHGVPEAQVSDLRLRAKLLMRNPGIAFDVPECLSLPRELRFYVDREHSNGVTHMTFPSPRVAAVYLHVRDKAVMAHVKKQHEAFVTQVQKERSLE